MAIIKTKYLGLDANANVMQLLNTASSTTDIAKLTIDSTYINSSYDDYYIALSIKPASDSVQFWFYFQEDGSDLTGSTDYRWRYGNATGNSYSGDSSDGNPQIKFNAGNMGGVGDEYVLVTMNILNVNSTTLQTRLIADTNYSNASGNLRSERMRAEVADEKKVINGMSFKFSSGNIDTYEYKLYGIKT